MEQRAILAVAISLAILLAYNELVVPNFVPGGTNVAPLEAGADGAPVPRAGDAPPAAAEAPAPEAALVPAGAASAQRVVVETDAYIATLTTAGGRLESFRLKDHKTSVGADSPLLDMVVPPGPGDMPLGVELRGLEAGKLVSLSDRDASYTIDGPTNVQLHGAERHTVSLRWQSEAGILVKRMHFRGDRPEIDVELDAESVRAPFSQIGLSWLTSTTVNGGEKLFDRTSYLQDRSLTEKHLEDSDLLDGLVVEPPRKAEEASWQWAGMAGPHFMVAMVPLWRDGAAPGAMPSSEAIDASAPTHVEDRPTLFFKQRGAILQQQILFPVRGGSTSQDLMVYIGAKRIETLEELGHKLSGAVDLGWFSFVALPMLWLMRQCHTFTGNYGIDIILLTVLVKILLSPLTHKSFVQMRGMQKLQPEMQAMRERLKDTPEQLQKEMMELYKRHGVNPLGGCLPMIVQIPVFIGLYQALQNAVELRHAPFFSWIVDLSAPDRLGTLAIPFVEPAGIPVLTLVMGATMFLQQWMTPSAGDPQQQRIMMIMPVMFTFMFISFPAGLVLYWTVNNVLTIAQQAYIHRTAA